MLILCRISIIGFHLLLISHIANSFVLLSANIEDVKKIARKFVSDSLAEKIVDFIAKATKNITENEMASEETKAEDSSQVSAENRMYNAERARNDQSEDIITSAEDEEGIVLAKDTIVMSKNSDKEKKGHKGKDYKDKELEYKAKEDKGEETGYKEYKDKEVEYKDKKLEYKDIEPEYKDKELEYINKEFKDKTSEYKDKESEYKNKEPEYKDKESEYTNKEYIDKKSEYKDKGLEYKNKESVYSDKESEYTNKKHKNKKSEYKDKESEYKNKESENSDKESEYTNKEFKDKKSEYKDKESEYNEKEDKETEYTKMSKPNKARKRAPKPLHRRSRYIDQGKTKVTEKSDINTKQQSDYKTLKEPAVTYVEDDEDITTPETKTKRENVNSNLHDKLHSLDSADDSTIGTPKTKVMKDEKPLSNSKSNEKATAKENESYNVNNKNTSDKAVNEFHEDDIGKNKKTNDNLKNKDTKMVASKPLPEKYDGDNNIIPRGEKVATSGSLVKEKDPLEERWWEKELPTRTQDVEVQAKGKSWF